MSKKTEMNPTEASKFYKVSRPTIYKWINDGLLKIKIMGNGKPLVLIEKEPKRLDEDDENEPRDRKIPVREVSQVNLFDERGRKVIPDSRNMEKLFELKDLLILIREFNSKQLGSAEWLGKPGQKSTNRPWQEDLVAMLKEYQMIDGWLDLCIEIRTKMSKAFRLSSDNLTYISDVLFNLKRYFDVYYIVRPQDTMKYSDGFIPINEEQYRKERKGEIDTALKLTRQCASSMSPDANKFRNSSARRELIRNTQED